MQRESLKGPKLVLAIAASIDHAAADGKCARAQQDKLICDLSHILAKLDAMECSLAAIHVETAIRALKSERV